MKQLFNRSRIVVAVALLTLAAGCATSNAPSENLLAAAGFQQRTADTPKKQELLKSLPPGKLSLIQWKGKPYYVQPDVGSNVAWVGTPGNYQTYQQLRLAKQLSNDNLMAAQMNQDAI